jgi:hypothetical protein
VLANLIFWRAAYDRETASVVRVALTTYRVSSKISQSGTMYDDVNTPRMVVTIVRCIRDDPQREARRTDGGFVGVGAEMAAAARA